MTHRRRTVLTAIASGLAGVAGCSLRPSGGSDPSTTVPPVPPPQETPAGLAPVDENWSSFQADAGNTGAARAVTGPGDVPDIAWRTATWGLATDPVLADGTAFVVTDLQHPDRQLLAVDLETGERCWQGNLAWKRSITLGQYIPGSPTDGHPAGQPEWGRRHRHPRPEEI